MHRVSNCPSAGLARTLSKACVLVIKLHCLLMPTESSIWTSKALSPGWVQTLARLSHCAVYSSPFLFPRNRGRGHTAAKETREVKERSGISQPPTGGFCPLALTSFSLGGTAAKPAAFFFRQHLANGKPHVGCFKTSHTSLGFREWWVLWH